MNYSKLQDTDELKLALKNLTIEDIDQTITALSAVLIKKKQNDMLLFKVQLKDFQRKKNLSLLTEEELRIRKIQMINTLTGYIDDLKNRHFKTEIINQFQNRSEAEPIVKNKNAFPSPPIHPPKNTQPIVALLVFSNDIDDPLGNLKTEEQEIQLALQHFKKAGGNIEIITLSSVKELFDYFTLYKGQIGLIHYGGHASGNGLQIDGTMANAKGLANLMGTESNLQFVFLNGCATKNQVKLLQENKVRTVIATNVPVSDSKASNFAIRFYQNLTYFGGENTLAEAFKHAKAYIETTETMPVEVQQTRGFVFDNVLPLNSFNWSLYNHPDFSDSLSWRLPKIGVNLKVNNTTNIHTPVVETSIVNNLSATERKSLEEQKQIAEKRIGQYKRRLLSGGLSLDQEFAAQDKIEVYEKELAKIKKELGII